MTIRRPENFAEFAHMIVSQTDLEMNPHWRSQDANLILGQIPYTFIGRFETYAEDFVRAFAAIGVVGEAVPALRHLNKSRHQGVRLSEFYDKTLQKLVYQRYQADFETFGYAYALPEYSGPRRLYRLRSRTFFSRRFTDGDRWLAKIPTGAPLTTTLEFDDRIWALTTRAPYCFKDPRFSYTLPVWQPRLRNTRFVVVFRDPTISERSMLQESQAVPKLERLKLTFADCLEVWRLIYTHILDIHSQEGTGCPCITIRCWRVPGWIGWRISCR